MDAARRSNACVSSVRTLADRAVVAVAVAASRTLGAVERACNTRPTRILRICGGEQASSTFAAELAGRAVEAHGQSCRVRIAAACAGCHTKRRQTRHCGHGAEIAHPASHGRHDCSRHTTRHGTGQIHHPPPHTRETAIGISKRQLRPKSLAHRLSVQGRIERRQAGLAAGLSRQRLSRASTDHRQQWQVTKESAQPRVLSSEQIRSCLQALHRVAAEDAEYSPAGQSTSSTNRAKREQRKESRLALAQEWQRTFAQRFADVVREFARRARCAIGGGLARCVPARTQLAGCTEQQQIDAQKSPRDRRAQTNSANLSVRWCWRMSRPRSPNTAPVRPSERTVHAKRQHTPNQIR
jgi:hypothetical protein